MNFEATNADVSRENLNCVKKQKIQIQLEVLEESGTTMKKPPMGLTTQGGDATVNRQWARDLISHFSKIYQLKTMVKQAKIKEEIQIFVPPPFLW